MNKDNGEMEHQYMHSQLKLNVDILVNSLRDFLLDNTIDLTSLTRTWVVMRATYGNINNWLELHITGQGYYIRTSRWSLTPTKQSHCCKIESLFFVILLFKYSPNNQPSNKPNFN